jgi:alkyldihydroxyacetonephosphate synthase
LETAADLKAAIEHGIAETGERVLVFAHLSHVYNDGASIYVTYLFRRSADPEETLHRWQLMKSAASRVIVAHKGTISHQHGVGLDHAPYLTAEKGQVGLEWLAGLMETADPDRLLNPGKLLPLTYESALIDGHYSGEPKELNHVDTRLAQRHLA